MLRVAIVRAMRKKTILLYAVLLGILGAAGWRIYSGASDLTDLSRIEERHSSGPYHGEKRIMQALRMARRDGKRVLIQSSAQGCGWCHVLNSLMTTNQEIMAKIDHNYVYVLVDTTNDEKREFYKKYAQNTDHTLVLVVLDSDGKQLTQSIGFDIVQADPQHAGDFHITPEHIMSFLNDWSQKRL
jgi:thioredoxin-related protein